MTSSDPRADLDVTVEVGARTLRLTSTWGLFSPREVAAGTRLLLDCLEVGEADRCLDLGCGYGPIGLAMAVMIRQLWPAMKREAERVFGNAEKVRLGAKHVVLRARRR